MIVFLTGGRRCPSDRFRIYAHLPALQEAGIPYRVQPTWTPRYPSLWLPARVESFLPIRAACATAQAAGRALDIARIGADDVVIIQREALSWGPAWVEKRIAQKAKRVVVDLDDAVHIPATFESERKRRTKKRRWNDILACADFMIVGNQTLAELPKSRGIPHLVIPSPVDTDYYLATPRPPGTTIGWVGTRSNLCYVEPLLPVLKDLAAEFPDISFEFVVNQARAVKLDLPRTKIIEWNFEAEKAALARWHIGIMPLADDAWSRGKCGMKLLQYMAAGVAAVASPVGLNEEILGGEAGLAARSNDEWWKQLRVFIEDPALRARYVENARMKVEEGWSLKKWSPVFVEMCRSFLMSGTRVEVRGTAEGAFSTGGTSAAQ